MPEPKTPKISKKVQYVYLFAYDDGGVECIMCGPQGPFIYMGDGKNSVEPARRMAQTYADHYGFPVKVLAFGKRARVALVNPEEEEGNDAPLG